MERMVALAETLRWLAANGYDPDDAFRRQVVHEAAEAVQRHEQAWTPREQKRLDFARWLYQTDRLTDWPAGGNGRGRHHV